MGSTEPGVGVGGVGQGEWRKTRQEQTSEYLCPLKPEDRHRTTYINMQGVCVRACV